jgi:hypothetical protein
LARIEVEMSTVEEFVRDMESLASETTPEKRAEFEAWVASLPEAPDAPEERTTAIINPGLVPKQD